MRKGLKISEKCFDFKQTNATGVAQQQPQLNEHFLPLPLPLPLPLSLLLFGGPFKYIQIRV